MHPGSEQLTSSGQEYCHQEAAAGKVVAQIVGTPPDFRQFYPESSPTFDQLGCAALQEPNFYPL